MIRADLGSQDGAEIDEKRCLKNNEKTMTTKMAKKLHADDHGAIWHHRFGVRGGGRGGVNHSSRHGSSVWKESWKEDGRIWKEESRNGSKDVGSPYP